MRRGVTSIQVELYKSEGQSYELCRSEKKILLTTKNRLLKHSCIAAELHGLHKLLRSKTTYADKLIYKLTLQCSYLINFTHYECRSPTTRSKTSFLFFLSNTCKHLQTKAGLKSIIMFLTVSWCYAGVWLIVISLYVPPQVADSSTKAWQVIFSGWACLLSAVHWAKADLQDAAVISVITLSFPAREALLNLCSTLCLVSNIFQAYDL